MKKPSHVRRKPFRTRWLAVGLVVLAGALVVVSFRGASDTVGAATEPDQESVAGSDRSAESTAAARNDGVESGSPGAAPAAPAPDSDWAMRTERTLREIARNVAPAITLESVSCQGRACRLDLRHSSDPAAGESVQQLIHDAMDLLPDSVLQPDADGTKTVLTLSRGADDEVRIARDDTRMNPRHRK